MKMYTNKTMKCAPVWVVKGHWVIKEVLVVVV